MYVCDLRCRCPSVPVPRLIACVHVRACVLAPPRPGGSRGGLAGGGGSIPDNYGLEWRSNQPAAAVAAAQGLGSGDSQAAAGGVPQAHACAARPGAAGCAGHATPAAAV